MLYKLGDYMRLPGLGKQPWAGCVLYRPLNGGCLLILLRDRFKFLAIARSDQAICINVCSAPSAGFRSRIRMLTYG